MSIFGNKNYKISKEERTEILEDLKKGIKKEIVACELNIRYLEREKVSASDKKLLEVENGLTIWKMTLEGLGVKLEVTDDELSGK